MRASRDLLMLLTLGLLSVALGGCDDRLGDKLVFDNPRDPDRLALDDDGDGVANSDDACPLMSGEALPDEGVCVGVKLACPADKADEVAGYQADETLCDELDNDCDGETDEAVGCQAGNAGGADGGGPTPGEGGEGEGGGPPAPSCDVCGICELDGPGPLGASCGRTNGCRPVPLTAGAFAQCLDDQCAEGRCVDEAFCDRPCDDDDDCLEALDGPVGAAFACVRPGDGPGVCRPGTNDPCVHDDECGVVGELCVVDDVRGSGEAFVTCQTRVKCALAAGQACDQAPGDDEVTHCQGRLCIGGRCTKPCAGGDDCLLPYDRCDDATMPLAPTSAAVVPICLGAACDTPTGCGEDQVCSIFVSRPDPVEPAKLVGACSRGQATGFARVRGGCGDDPALGTDRTCNGALCDNWNLLDPSSCLPVCGEEADCQEGERCQELRVCVSRLDDGRCDWATGLFCTPSPGSASLCGSSRECPEGEACRAVLERAGAPGVGPDALSTSARCHDPAGRKTRGQECDLLSDCDSGICLNTGESGQCFELCAGSRDCNEDELCHSISLSGDPAAAWNVCAGKNGSGATCPAGQHDCDGVPDANVDEFCTSVAIAATGVVEFRCVVPQGDGAPGERCEAGGECQSGICWPGPQAGTCDRGCSNDGDCPGGLQCMWSEMSDPHGDWPRAVARRCRKAAECQLCAGGSECGDGMTCSFEDDARGDRLGVCLLECNSQEDCELSDLPGETRCTVAREEDGDQLQDSKVCAPTNVQQCGWPGVPEGGQ